MDVLALILACSLHSDDALVRTMVDVQSGGNMYFVGDLATLKTNDSLTSAADALRAADEIANHGGRPAVGLLGVPLDWAARFGHGPLDLFNGCTNIAIGTAMFSEYADACPLARPASRLTSQPAHGRRLPARRTLSLVALRSCVLTRLATALGLHGTPAEILKRVGLVPAKANGEAPPQTSSIFGDGTDDAQQLPAEWSDARIYLDASDHVRGSGSEVTPAPPPRRSPGSPSPTQPPLPSPSPAGRGLPPIRLVPRALPAAAAASQPPTSVR
jgi:hypothetical protein